MVDMDGDYIPLFSLLAVLLVVGLYPILMLYIAFQIQVWYIIYPVWAAMLTPFVVLWYHVVKKRTLNYLKLLLGNEPREWNLEKTLKEYVELLKKRKKGGGEAARLSSMANV